ncbi:MAG TPA: thioredoxin family protein [Thermoplasmata archaeon]|nr:thioredoxin family protein [Thermoplasmata archaeon]
MPHVIEVFTAGCPLCRSTLGMVEIGKCASCLLIERDLAKPDVRVHRLARKYGIRAAPTIVVDGKIKVEGKPDFLWMCGDDFYARLEREFPLHPSRKALDQPESDLEL